MPGYIIPTNGFARLPNEVIELILLLLPRQSQLSCLTLCKNWFTVVISILYNSVNSFALVKSSPSLAPFKKYSHLIREIRWGLIEPSDPRIDAAKHFLFQGDHHHLHPPYPLDSSSDQELSHQLQQVGKNRLLLTSLIYYGFSVCGVEPFLFNLLAHHPTLTKIHLVGSIGTGASLSLDSILTCLPHLKEFKALQYTCSPLDLSRWSPIQDNSNSNNSTLDSIGTTSYLSPPTCPDIAFGPPFGLQTFSFINAFKSIVDYEIFFGALPNLVSLELHTGALPEAWSTQLTTALSSPSIDGISQSWPWNEEMASQLSRSLIRNCTKLKSVVLRDQFSVATLNVPQCNTWVQQNQQNQQRHHHNQQYHPTQCHTQHPHLDNTNNNNGNITNNNNNDPREQFERDFSRVMKEFRSFSFRKQQSALNWMINFFSDGITELNISLSYHIVDIQTSDITSRDLQHILESCPNLCRFLAAGRILRVRDMAPRDAFLTTTTTTTTSSFNHNDDNTIYPTLNNNGYNTIATDPTTIRSSTPLPPSIIPKPWACSKTLEKLEIGIMAETDDRTEHERAWIQLGQVTKCKTIELSRTNLIPKLSHGIGMLSDMDLLYSFLMTRWEVPMPANNTISSDDNDDPNSETERRRSMLMDSETLVWIAKRWRNLLILKLDMSGVEELMQEMRVLLETEKKCGRMRLVQLHLK